MSEKNAHIKRLCADIKTVAEAAQESNRRTNAEAEKQQSEAQRAHATSKAKLEEEISTLKRQLQETEAENKEREQDMRKVRVENNIGGFTGNWYFKLPTFCRKHSKERLKLRTGYINMMQKWEKNR